MNKISLCITAYSGDYKLLSSVLQQFTYQTFCPYEIIVYISNITSIDIPDKLNITNKFVPIHYILSSKLTMQSIARNICSSVATGEIIVFFDVDDIPHPQKLEITNYVFNTYNIDFFLHNYLINSNLFSTINLSTLNLKNNLHINTNNTNVVCDEWPIHHAHIAIKKSVFKKLKFNESLEMYRKEDGKFCQDLISNNYTGYYCTSPLVSYTT